jgi:CubicO group peptidase (beta-lactamase class C family)
MRSITRRDFLYGGAIAAITCALPTWPFAEAVGQAKPRPAAFARVDDYVKQRLRELNAPGMILAIADRNGPAYTGAYGLADLKTRTPVTASHLFEIGSISKSFTAICALQLHEEGKLDLHKPIQAYLPWLQIDSGNVPITCQHLLSHTSGLPGWPPLQPRAPFQKLWVGFEPGTQYSYSNVGYQILGLILEKLDARQWPFFGILRERVLHPLRMMDTEGEIRDRIRPETAVGYVSQMPSYVHPPRGPLAEAPWIEMTYASGSIASTAPDMAKYMTMLLNHGAALDERILKPASFDLMSSAVHAAPAWGNDASYGYGMAIDHPGGHLRMRHTGGMVAFASAIHLDLTDGLAAFASTNCRLDEYRPNEIVAFALEVMRAKNTGKPLPELPAADDPSVIPNAAEYAGEYGLHVRAYGNELYITLSVDVSGALLRVGPDTFACQPTRVGPGPAEPLPPHLVRFGRQDGKVVEMFLDGFWYPGKNYSGPRTFDYPKEWDAFAGEYQNNDPWFGRSRVVVSKGQLTMDGAVLVPLGGNLFRVGEESYSPERASFDVIAEGKAMRMNFSGQDFNRV